MAVYLYDLPLEYDFVIDAELDNEPYKIRFRWNEKDNCWTFSLKDELNNSIIEGVKIVPNYPLLRRFKREGFPQGEFTAIVLDNKKESIGYEDFYNGSASFLYTTADELEAIKNGAI